MTKEALDKIAQFVNVALSEISELTRQVQSHQTKEASAQLTKDRELDAALQKAAEAMYSSDFITDEDEKALFVKKAREDSKYLARVVERVCKAADVSYMGKVATVKAGTQSEDPVIRRAFGYEASYSLLDE
jgi:hypothetical protein